MSVPRSRAKLTANILNPPVVSVTTLLLRTWELGRYIAVGLRLLQLFVRCDSVTSELLKQNIAY
jgi:hypothetical protein